VVDPATADQLVQSFTAFDGDTSASVAVLGGRRYVCSGHELKFAATLADPEKFWHEVADHLALDAEGRGRGGAFERGVL
jgi:enoyl-CoA hydratase/carnithine racemase